MAFYRCGGGGIPSSLKTDMNAVLNKKFGTSSDYPPADWAPTVNLMGPLPERTASGSIAHITDGADRVPIKSWEVTLPASLDGYSSVDAVQTGDSVFLPMDIEQGSISGSGFNSDSIYRIRTAERKAVTPSTQYKIKVNSEVQIYEVHEYTDLTGSSTHLTVNASEYTFTTKSTTNYLKILFRYSNNTTITPSAITELQVTDGELYWKTYTASLGRTIYGGTADVVNGTGEGKCGKIVFDGSSDENWTAYAGGNGYLIAVADMERGTWYTSEFAESSPLPKVPDNNSLGVRIGVNNNGVYVVQANTIEGVTDLASFKAYLAENPLTVVYPLDDSEAFTFTPITPTPETALGVNNFWADEGDSEVTYRADIDLALGGE